MKKTLIETAIVSVLFLAATLYYENPRVPRYRNGVFQDLGDPLQRVWVLAWEWKHFEEGLNGYWTINALAPYRNSLAFIDHSTFLAVIGYPLFAFTRNALLAYNILHLLTSVFSGAGGYLLARYLRMRRTAAFLSAFLFTFSAYRFDHLAHLELLMTGFLPLVVLAFLAFLDRQTWRRFLLLVLVLYLQAITSIYYILYASLGISVAFLFHLPSRPRGERLPLAARLAGAYALVLLAAVPFLIPYWEVHRDYGVEAPKRAMVATGGTFLTYLSMPWNNEFWRPLVERFSRNESTGMILVTAIGLMGVAFASLSRGPKPVETCERRYSFHKRIVELLMLITLLVMIQVYVSGPIETTRAWLEYRIEKVHDPNSLLLLLAILRLFAFPDTRHSIVEWYRGLPTAWKCVFWIGVTGLVFSFYHPFYRMRQALPVFRATRVPGRFAVLVSLAASLFAGYGFQTVLGRLRRPAAFCAGLALAGLIALETETAPMTMPYIPGPDEVPEVYRWMGEQPPSGFGVYVELPIIDVFSFTRYQYFSTYHWQRMLNGYQAYVPGENDRIVRSLRDFPSEATLATLQEHGVRHVVLHTDTYAGSRPVEWSAMRKQIEESLGTGLLSRVWESGETWVLRLADRPVEQFFPETLRVRVRDGATGLPLQRVKISIQRGGRAVAERYDREGECVFENLAPGLHRVVARYHTHEYVDAETPVRVGEANEILLDLLPEEVYVPPAGQAMLEGSLIDGDGTPLRFVEISLKRDGEVVARDWDRGGRFRFLDLRPGLYSLIARPAGEEQGSVVRELAVEAGRNIFDIQLDSSP